MKCLLHIGPPKTGTTSMQITLRANKEMLLDKGIVFFEETEYALYALPALFHTDRVLDTARFKAKFETPDDVRGWSEGIWEDLQKAVEAHKDAKCFVISSEHFAYGVDVPGLLDLMQEIFSEVHVISYMRDPVDLYFSILQQRIRTGSRLAQLGSPRKYDYPGRSLIEPFSQQLGNDNIILRNFSRDNLVDGDAVQDFFAQLSKFANTPLEVKSVQQNTALPGAVLAYLLMLNDLQDTLGNVTDFKHRSKLMKSLKKSDEISVLPKLKMAEGDFQKILLSRCREDCVWLNENFLAGQTQLRVGEPVDMSTMPWHKALLGQLRDEIMGYLSQDAARLVGEHVISVDRAR